MASISVSPFPSSKFSVSVNRNLSPILLSVPNVNVPTFLSVRSTDSERQVSSCQCSVSGSHGGFSERGKRQLKQKTNRLCRTLSMVPSEEEGGSAFGRKGSIRALEDGNNKMISMEAMDSSSSSSSSPSSSSSSPPSSGSSPFNFELGLAGGGGSTSLSSPSSASSSSLSSSSSSSSASYSSSGNEDTTYNKRAILDCLVETLGLSNDEFKEGKPMPFQIAYVVTLLKHGTKLKSKYEIVLREFLSTKLDGCSLEDLQALELETVVSLITGYTDYVTPLEEGKMFRIGALVDNYILWAACHCEGFRLPDCQKLVEILPGSFRKDFDTLYDGIDAFLDKNPDVNGGDVLRLCDALDPFKLSQSKIGMAVQNSRIPWQQGFFKSLCLAQNKALDSQKNLISTLEAELKGLREDLKTKDNRMAGALRQLDIAVTKNSRVMFPLRMEVSTQVPCQFPVVSIAVVPDGTVWVGGDSLSCYKEDKCLWKAEPKYSEFEALSFNGDNLWAGCHNGKILLIKAFKVVEEVKGHELSVSALWATSENWCFSGGFDKRVTIWKWCGNHIIRGWTSVKGAGHKGPIHAVCVDAKGKLWSASGDGTIKCWERISSEPFSDWKCVKTLMDKHSGPVRALAIGKYLFSGGSDGAINCWTLGGDLVKKMLGHNDLIQALVIDEDEVLWSGSDDHTIRGWKGPWRDGKCIAILDTHTDWVWALAIDVNNKLWSGSNDKTVVMWKASE